LAQDKLRDEESKMPADQNGFPRRSDSGQRKRIDGKDFRPFTPFRVTVTGQGDRMRLPCIAPK
jgi:hypothetical protein